MVISATPNSVPVAIYTRKSTDANVEQEVHSLSVQRASSESFVESQKHLGWYVVKEQFDDNNASGATLERKALDRLKQRVIEGKVKVVLINRLDRISRSLSQFLDLMDFFDRHGVSLVSVTQNFNTGDTMGRLMIQIIMSFAEFERGIIRDRVTERMHNARKKGRFIGGRPVMGYNTTKEAGVIEVNEVEAIRVRQIFELYLELRSVKATVLELRQRGWNNKKWVTKQGKVTGGAPFSKNGLHTLLTNPIYIGKVTLNGEVFEGKHDGVLDPELFESVQSMLQKNSVQQGNRKRNRHDALLKGLLYCTACDAPFSHTYTKKKNRMYRYYTCSHKRFEGSHTCPSPSLSAGEIEGLVTEQLLSIGSNPGLQDTVYQQLFEVVARKQDEQQQQVKTAKQQLARIKRELQSSREFDTADSLVSHLEVQKAGAEELLGKAATIKLRKPTKKSIQEALSNMHELWPSFNAGEKCDFVRTLVQRVDYDALDERVTLHFNENGFGLGGGE